MHITTLKIKNFRALTDIEATFEPRCNVVVGPNAIGKTTLLDAIRLVKALFSARTQNEATQVLLALGAMTPHNQTALNTAAIANDPTKPISISCGIQFSAEEISLVAQPESLFAIATQMMLINMGRQFSPQTELIGLLSSPQGQQIHNVHLQAISAAVSELQSGNPAYSIAMEIEPLSGQITSIDPIGPTLFGYLDRRLAPNRTIFSYFPADRAIPTQEQPVQIGPGDAINQLEAHNSQPQLKYSRLKNTIFNAVVSGRDNEQREQFKTIFTRILKGRTLLYVKVSDQGMLKIEVQDDESKKTFGIEAMSSGEKGLILTCLTIAQTLERGGIVLLDEPELHLNPAVCREVLNFLVEEYAEPNDLQLIICSHSPEILGVAFDREDCELYHLISGNVLTPVRKQDLEEVGDALKKLGASQAESLLYRGTVFVEGDSDSELLLEGFKTLFQRYAIRDLGGRKNIEKEVQFLQSRQQQAEHPFKTYFILDKDDEPTTLKTSSAVGILQWKRRCLENYLLDFNILTDIVKDSALVANPITNITTLQKTLKQMAFNQIDEIAFWNVFKQLEIANVSVKPREVKDHTFTELAELILARIKAMREKYSSLDDRKWTEDLVSECKSEKRRLEAIWVTTWRDECDGKRLIRELYGQVNPKENLTRFKMRVIARMESTKSEEWVTMERQLRALIDSSDAGE